MSTDKMREEFEAAFKAENGYTPLRNHYGDGSDYESPYCNGAWWAWQASRAAIEVELPKPSESYGCMGEGMGDPDYSIAYEDAVEAIESLGLKVKP